MKELTDWQIDAKHERLRGSNALKYPPNNLRCIGTCGHYHDEVGDKMKEHRCFLAVGHREKFCQFSSVCGEKRVRAVTLNVGVAAA